MCQGHCNTCDTETGISCTTDPRTDKSGCHCHNNTKSPTNCATIDDLTRPCYTRQVRVVMDTCTVGTVKDYM